MAAQDLVRLKQIAGIVARHGYAHLAAGLRSGKVDPLDLRVREEASRAGGPARFRALLQDLGPTFIKLGQVLSSRPDLVPTEYQRELARLQDAVDPVPYEEIEAQLTRAWGGPVSGVVARINKVPLATASIAQVHRAWLRDGRAVVLKVQRPNLERTIRADMDLLFILARLLDATVEEMALYRPIEVVRLFERALLDELDFTLEASNARLIAANFADDPRVKVPDIIDHLSGREVLVLEYVEGVKITDMGPEHDVETALRTLLDIAFSMGFTHGVFHADPHPGNVLVLPDNRICMIDFGLVGRLTHNMQQVLIQLSLAVSTRDADTTTRLMYRIGRPLDRVQLHEFRDHIADVMNRHLARRLDEVDAAGLINELMDMAIQYRIRIPPNYALLAKATVTIEGIVRQVKPDMDIVPIVRQYAQRLMMERYSPEAVTKLAMRSAVGLLDSAQELPLLAHQLLSDLEAGRLELRIKHPEMDRLTRTLNDLGTKLFLGMVAMGMILGTFFVVARYPWEYKGFNLWAVGGAVGGLGLFVMVVSWHVAYTRIRKVKMRAVLRFFGRGR